MISQEVLTAWAPVITGLVTIFGVKLLDVLAGNQSKRMDELATVRSDQGKRITALEAERKAIQQEFDDYKDEVNEKMNALLDQIRELRAENGVLKRLLEGKYNGRAEGSTHVS